MAVPNGSVQLNTALFIDFDNIYLNLAEQDKQAAEKAFELAGRTIRTRADLPTSEFTAFGTPAQGTITICQCCSGSQEAGHRSPACDGTRHPTQGTLSTGWRDVHGHQFLGVLEDDLHFLGGYHSTNDA